MRIAEVMKPEAREITARRHVRSLERAEVKESGYKYMVAEHGDINDHEVNRNEGDIN